MKQYLVTVWPEVISKPKKRKKTSIEKWIGYCEKLQVLKVKNPTIEIEIEIEIEDDNICYCPYSNRYFYY